MVVQAELSSLVFLKPILAFLVVLVVLFALLVKSKLLSDNAFANVFAAFLVATIFVSVTGVRELVLSAVPWFAVLLIALFFILVLVNFIGKGDIAGKGLGWFFVVIMILVFVFAGIKVFSSGFGAYVPGPYYGHDANPELLFFFDWFWSPHIIGTVVFAVIAGIVMFVLVRGK